MLAMAKADSKPDAKVEDSPESEVAPDDAQQEGAGDAKPEAVTGAMSEQQIRDAGLAIDVPYESPPGNPAPLQYADDLPDEKGWQPPEGFTVAGVPYEQAVTGVGTGGSPEASKGAQADPHAGAATPQENPRSSGGTT
jgi:hypothetical protein